MNATNKNHTRLSFFGDAQGKSTVRTHVSFKAPLEVVAEVDKTDECSNHFVVISRRKYFTWNWDEDKHSVKFAWRCDKKVLIGPHSYTSTMCSKEKQYKIYASINNESISFRDDGGCTTLTVNTPDSFLGPRGNNSHDYYVYVGAAQPTMVPFHPARIDGVDRVRPEPDTIDATGGATGGATGLAFVEEASSIPDDSTDAGTQRDITRTGAELNAEQRKRLKWPKECREIYCPTHIKPVCGSDSKTYDNECLLMLERCKRGKAGTELTSAYEGACQKFAANSPAHFSSFKVIGQGALIQRDDGSKACPQLVHCRVSEWSEWSNCSASCDQGMSNRTRTIIRHPKHGGNACPVLVETKTCHTRKCDCGVTQ